MCRSRSASVQPPRDVNPGAPFAATGVAGDDGLRNTWVPAATSATSATRATNRPAAAIRGRRRIRARVALARARVAAARRRNMLDGIRGIGRGDLPPVVVSAILRILAPGRIPRMGEFDRDSRAGPAQATTADFRETSVVRPAWDAP